MILLILLAVAVSFGTWQYNRANGLAEDLATSQEMVKEANRQTEEQKRQNVELKMKVAAEQEALKVLGDERRKDDIRYQKELAKINAERSRAEAHALKYPRRYSNAATFDLRRSMRSACRSGGGDKEACRIETVPPFKAESDSPAESDPGSTGSVGSGTP